jgi:membrane-associated PAP2 superfamily phosphatase
MQVIARDERSLPRPIDLMFLLVLAAMLIATLAALSASGTTDFGDWGTSEVVPYFE